MPFKGMDRITLEQAMEICRKRELKPARVRGIAGSLQFTKGRNKRLEPISWEEFGNVLAKKRLAVYSWKGWLKIGKAH